MLPTTLLSGNPLYPLSIIESLPPSGCHLKRREKRDKYQTGLVLLLSWIIFIIIRDTVNLAVVQELIQQIGL